MTNTLYALLNKCNDPSTLGSYTQSSTCFPHLLPHTPTQKENHLFNFNSKSPIILHLQVEKMVIMGLERLMGTLKTKLTRSIKGKKPYGYDEIEKSESMRIEIRSRKARKLIEETLKIADSPTRTSASI